MAQRWIAHIDMDAFFAAVEQAHHPQLKGKPVIVGGPPESRGVVSTCSYEAREYGVHSAMSSAQAIKLCPNGLFVQTSSNKINHISMAIMKILYDFSPQVEPFSVDEAFLDITKTAQRYGGPGQLAIEVKKRIWENHRLTASIGISSIRFVAKMASSENKPDGLTIIEPGKEIDYLWPQPVGNLWGVGPKSVAAFNKIGIRTIGDLAKFPRHRLKKYFGIVGESLKEMANGIGDDEIRQTDVETDDKSMGHEFTFEKDILDPNRLHGMLLFLADKVSRRMRLSGYKGRTITLKIKHSDTKLKTRARTLFIPTDCAISIFENAKYLLENNRFIESPIRLIGVSVSKLEKVNDEIQPDLLDDPKEKIEKVGELIDCLRNKYGENSICYAGSQLKF